MLFLFICFACLESQGSPRGKGPGKVTWSSLSWERSLEEFKYPIQSHLETSSGGDFIASLGRFFPRNDCFYCKKKKVSVATFCIGICLYFYRDRKLYKLGLKGFYVKDDNDSTGKVIQCTMQCDVQSFLN